MKRHPWMPSFFLKIAVLSAGAACGTPGSTQKPEARPPGRETMVPTGSERPVPRPDPERVDEFDRLIQARFKDLREGTFGISRMARRGPGNRRHFEPKFEIERLSLEHLRAAGWSVVMYLVEPRSEPTTAGSVRGPVESAGSAFLRRLAHSDVEDLAIRAMAEKAHAQGVIEGLPMEARPVLASSTACLGCHADRKLGDSLGAVVYSFISLPIIPQDKP